MKVNYLELLRKLLRITQENPAYLGVLSAEIKLLGNIPVYLGNYLELLRTYLEQLRKLLRIT